MEKKMFKYIAVSYKLYTNDGNETVLEEETEEGKPFVFLSGFGATIPGFEKNIEPLAEGAEFDFTIEKEEAYGDFFEERVLDLDKQIFSPNGRFDSENVYVDAYLPLQNEDGNRFMGHVLAITDDKVKIDLNHPLAGKSLNFTGKVLTSREAINEEIQQMVNQMSGGCGGCGGNCGGGCGGNCGGDCGGECDGDCNCNK